MEKLWVNSGHSEPQEMDKMFWQEMSSSLNACSHWHVKVPRAKRWMKNFKNAMWMFKEIGTKSRDVQIFLFK